MPRTSGTGKAQGFTLLELMVVMAILVMVATLFPFALDRAMPSRRVSTTAETIASMVHEAEAASALSGKAVALRLRAHALVAQDAATAATVGRAVAFPSTTDVRFTNTEGQAVSAVILYPDGSAQSAEFDIEDNGHRGTVRLSGLTGRTLIAAGR
jgi:type II secretion system protein H